ncbi:MAG: hypothetical protein JWP58_1267 [Hymenobacter sp.]|nr:hypothetical protein [Hymenobacter sp.]
MSETIDQLAHYHNHIRIAEKLFGELTNMQAQLRSLEQQLMQNGQVAKAMAITTCLRMQAGNMSGTAILKSLYDISKQIGFWNPAANHPFEERNDKAGVIGLHAGELGGHWLELLKSYSIPNLPTDPLYTKD